MRFCPTPDLASRPHSFDGTPIDVDVTLPATGAGPFRRSCCCTGSARTRRRLSRRQARSTARTTTPRSSPSRGMPSSPRPRAASATRAAMRWRERLTARRASPASATCATRSVTSRRWWVSSVDEKIVRPNAIGATGRLLWRWLLDHARLSQEPDPSARRRLCTVAQPARDADLAHGGLAAVAVVQRCVDLRPQRACAVVAQSDRRRGAGVRGRDLRRRREWLQRPVGRAPGRGHPALEAAA